MAVQDQGVRAVLAVRGRVWRDGVAGLSGGGVEDRGVQRAIRCAGEAAVRVRRPGVVDEGLLDTSDGVRADRRGSRRTVRSGQRRRCSRRCGGDERTDQRDGGPRDDLAPAPSPGFQGADLRAPSVPRPGTRERSSPAVGASAGGGGGNRTRVQGFADLCLCHSATPPGGTERTGLDARNDVVRLVDACRVRYGAVLQTHSRGMRPMTDRVRLELDGAIAIITNDNPEKHNAFDDEMDARLFEILSELRGRSEVRAVVWRGEGKSFSSGRDVSAIGAHAEPVSHHELMRRGHRGIQQLWDLDAPVIVACKGWVMGASFQRALLCDMRIAAEGARFRLPELTYGVIPDTGGTGALFEMAGAGLVSDLVLTSRVLTADEALAHGVVSRIVGEDELDVTVREIAEHIASLPAVTVKMAREVIRHLAVPAIRSSMADEMIYQTFVNKSDDIAELRAARAEDRAPRYTGS